MNPKWIFLLPPVFLLQGEGGIEMAVSGHQPDEEGTNCSLLVTLYSSTREGRAVEGFHWRTDWKGEGEEQHRE